VKALGNHGYAVDMKVETQKGDTVDGVFHRAYVVDFDASGARREAVAPEATNTLGRLKLADKDIGLLGDPMSLALTADSFADRDIVYSGREKYGEHNLALFDALPDYPIGDMRFEVLRAQVVDENYYPVTIRADEEISIDGVPVHIRLTVKYSDYTPKP